MGKGDLVVRSIILASITTAGAFCERLLGLLSAAIAFDRRVV
jgi:hypothetical protein